MEVSFPKLAEGGVNGLFVMSNSDFVMSKLSKNILPKYFIL